MKICLLTHEFPPFPGGGIATYTAAAATRLADAGHEVHVVTNREMYTSTKFEHGLDLFRSGRLIVHRLDLFNARQLPARSLRFAEMDLQALPDPWSTWAFDASNMAAYTLESFIESLHAAVGLDIIESPEYFAEAFYLIRRRRAGRSSLPPVCTIGHTSSRELLTVSRLVRELGRQRQRERMMREDYCVQAADGLQTPSRSLLQRYRARFGERLPAVTDVIPYYLDVGEASKELPRPLSGIRYLLAIGRIEPRKGSDLLVRAFKEVGARHPDLHLVFLGREAWRNGETFDDVLERELPKAMLERVVRLGNLDRSDVLAAVRGCAAFVHAAPWDNYPSAVLEAMALGARCVVSDSGGQAEMIEDGVSGLHFRANDVADLRQKMLEVLLPQSAKYGPSAARRVADLTHPETITQKKLELFDAVIRSAASASATPAAPRSVDTAASSGKGGTHVATLRGRGVVVIDVCGASGPNIEVVFAGVRSATLGVRDWSVVVLADHRQEIQLPDRWTRQTYLGTPPWTGLAADSVVLYVCAGVRFEGDGLHSLATLARSSPGDAGAFAWLRPPKADSLYYARDLAINDLLTPGCLLPAAFAVLCRRLASFDSLAGLETPESRICALMAGALRSDDAFLHSPDILGDYYGTPARVTTEEQERAIGFLECFGLVSRTLVPVVATRTVSTEPPAASSAQPPFNSQAAADIMKELESLRKIRDEHMRLKDMGLIRVLRKLKLFSAARTLFPKTRGVLGDGKRGGT